MSTGPVFTAAMVQMRTGLLPEASLQQGEALIREAAAAGAHYVQTPEVSNMMQTGRQGLFEHLAVEEEDGSLKAYRALAAELGIHLHIGSLAVKASPERAANRSFLIGPDGGVLAKYDKIHMFDIDLGNGESYRESANYQPGETAVISDLPWGRIGLTICMTCAFRRCIARWPRAARRFSPHRRPSPERPARRTGTRCCAPAPSRTAASCSPPRKAACTRTGARPMVTR